MKKKSIFNYTNFEQFIQNEVENNAQLKRGEKKRLAEYLNIHPTLLSQIFNGIRQFTDEQVFLLGEFFGFSELESEYVFILHQISSTQNKKFKDRLNKKKDALKNRSFNLTERVEKERTLNEEEKSIFYSSWQYSGVRVFSSLTDGKTRDEISERLGIGRKQVSEILQFLVNSGLCRVEGARYYHHVSRTHLESTSPHLKQHHSNWRIKSIQKMDHSDADDLSFTAPLSLSNKDFEFLREEMVQLIRKISETVKETDPDDIFCFNLDFFRI